MPRHPRIQYPGALYHITSRGSEKGLVFLDDKDRACFLAILSTVVGACEWRCYSYCLMGNHYHLLIETPKANLSKGMHRLNGVYALRFCGRHERVGHVFQRRFHDVIVDKEEYLMAVARYIVLNPVRAGICTDPADYRWSSYLDIMGKRDPADFLDVAFILSLFSQPGRSPREGYNDFVLSGMGSEIGPQLHRCNILGGEEFKARVRGLLSIEGGSPGRTAVDRSVLRPGLHEIFGDLDYGSEERNRRILRARGEYGYKLQEIAACVGIHRTMVGRIVREGLVLVPGT